MIEALVIPHVCDQPAMSRLPSESFALLLARLPAVAARIGIVALARIPSARDAIGVLLAMRRVAQARAWKKRRARRPDGARFGASARL